ncbi:type VI secretion protein [Burkholderia cepacia]|uniref:DUF3540 domain-containing protein n=1 Tax=Burkholderia cepacia TaxID=292 RepID=UPI00075DECFF|nr:DUF3540 domain-containing protein [Burkholderia cepacia]KVS54937.1 type VI secretion protein [Burkholderia cepacia]KVS74518.1 type VI secretion protein [Burkholderia cepacia]RQT71088.1 DUF3540 domain-containing protein [Burkholderia cepacia]RQT91814.1 DUF3540 domain-containing protein [Burkholderia cepacia]RQZ67681.1 DUF3540 domain-containing protein [Burkholderia cepacia]
MTTSVEPSAADGAVARACDSDGSHEAFTRIMNASIRTCAPDRLNTGTVSTMLARVSDAGVAARIWLVTIDAGLQLCARAAVSCIVLPEPGDLVQICVDGERCWVLAVLERREAGNGLALDFGDAHVTLRARDMRVEVRDELSLEAARFASRAQVVTQAAAERQTQVSGTDATHAGSTIVHTERHLAMHAKSAFVTASALMKIDAGQIHMG